MSLPFSITSGYPKRMGAHQKIVKGTVAFDNSYESGGEPVAASDLGLLSRIDDLKIDGVNGYRAEFDRASSLVKVFGLRIDDDDTAATAGTELYVDDDAASSGDLVKSVTAGNADVDVPCTELTAAHDLSGVTAAPFVAIGW